MWQHSKDVMGRGLVAMVGVATVRMHSSACPRTNVHIYFGVLVFGHHNITSTLVLPNSGSYSVQV